MSNLVETVRRVIQRSVKDENPLVFYSRLPKLENFPEASEEDIADAADLIISHAQTLRDGLELKLSKR